MIEVKGFSKKYGKLTVLKDVNLRIEEGSITAVVGPNGSGKTTLIKSMLGLALIEEGEIRINNHALNSECSYRRDIGYMPQLSRYPDNLSTRELLDMLKDLRNTREDLDEELIEKLDMVKEMDKPTRNLSGGTRQKVSAIIAFLFSPKLLMLDEPTAALDPVSSSYLKDKIIKENNRGKTIILTSHNMNEIDELSKNIIFLLEGRVFFEGMVDELKKLTGQENLERAVANLMKGSVS